MAPQQAASPYNEAGQSSSSELRFTFPVDKLEAYLLEKKLEGFVAPLKAEQFGMGQSNVGCFPSQLSCNTTSNDAFVPNQPTYKLISANGTTYVMRKKPPGGLVSSTAHQIEREYKIISAINRNVPDFPVPKAYLLEEREEIIGGGFFIMSFIEGRIFADPRLWSVQSAKDKEELWLSAARTLARLHKYTPKQLGLENLSAPGSTFYPRQLKSFTKLSQQQAKAIKDGGGVKGVAGTGDIPNFEEKLKWLENNIETVPKSEGVLMHGGWCSEPE
jgi:aminoglycoside phosphotransferase (APT) family kinase protein